METDNRKQIYKKRQDFSTELGKDITKVYMESEEIKDSQSNAVRLYYKTTEIKNSAVLARKERC